MLCTSFSYVLLRLKNDFHTRVTAPRFVFDFLFFNADSRAEGVEFQTILSASRLSDIFFNASFCRIGRFRFGCLKR